ncbi:MAG: hypothetical protein NTW08_01985 [Gammaproteobacteria bacterium]|nr:hypothetical protein [Gammaproteobacteria bacterium]
MNNEPVIARYVGKEWLLLKGTLQEDGLLSGDVTLFRRNSSQDTLSPEILFEVQGVFIQGVCLQGTMKTAYCDGSVVILTGDVKSTGDTHFFGSTASDVEYTGSWNLHDRDGNRRMRCYTNGGYFAANTMDLYGEGLIEKGYDDEEQKKWVVEESYNGFHVSSDLSKGTLRFPIINTDSVWESTGSFKQVNGKTKLHTMDELDKEERLFVDEALNGAVTSFERGQFVNDAMVKGFRYALLLDEQGRKRHLYYAGKFTGASRKERENDIDGIQMIQHEGEDAAKIYFGVDNDLPMDRPYYFSVVFREHALFRISLYHEVTCLWVATSSSPDHCDVRTFPIANKKPFSNTMRIINPQDALRKIERFLIQAELICPHKPVVTPTPAATSVPPGVKFFDAPAAQSEQKKPSEEQQKRDTIQQLRKTTCEVARLTNIAVMLRHYKPPMLLEEKKLQQCDEDDVNEHNGLSTSSQCTH